MASVDRNFWPRPSPRGTISAELDIDRPCGNCGYNMRGIPDRSPCPECGSVNGLNCTDDSIPWDDQQSFGAFILTVTLVLFEPQVFARFVWSTWRLDEAAAKRFRRMTWIVGTIILCAVAEEITRAVCGWHVAMLTLVLNIPAAVVWLNSVSLDPAAFFKTSGSPISHRAQTMAGYLSAGFLLMPLHLPLLVFSLRLVEIHQIGWLLAGGVHLLLQLLLLIPPTIGAALIFYELVDIGRARAFAMAMHRTTAIVGAAAPLLLGFPALVAAVASNAMGM